MDKKKIVILGSVIFPRNSPRAHRSTELAKEFARQGHDVMLYAVLGNYDYSNFEKEYNIEVKDLGRTKFYNINSDGESQNNSILNKLISKFLGRLLEFPSIELMFKVSKVLKREIDIDLLISVAVPFSIHWGVANFFKKQKKANDLTWVADCGDPFMGNKFTKHPFYFKYFEKWFCSKADYITIPILEAKEAYYEEFRDKIRVIPQGFNFNEFELPDYLKNDIPNFIYAGTLYKDKRDPSLFLEYLTTLNIDFKFTVYTRNKGLITPFLEQLEGKLFLKDYIEREELLNKMSKSDFLVNFENEGTVQSPSKLIDYALAGRPILSVGSKKINQEIIDEFFQEDYSRKLHIQNIEQYNIQNVVQEFVNL